MAYKAPHLQITVVDKNKHRVDIWKFDHVRIYELGPLELLRNTRDGISSSGTSQYFHLDLRLSFKEVSLAKIVKITRRLKRLLGS